MALSGMTQTFLMGAGIISIALCIYIQNFIKINSQQKPKINKLRITKYTFWILKEIAKADWEMVKIILDEKINIQQQIIKLKVNQKFDITKTILANSITLTPGTITIETLQTQNNENQFLIHAIAKKSDDPKNTINELNKMERKVTELEKI